MGKTMDELQLTGQDLFNSRGGNVYAVHSRGYLSKLPNLKLKTRPKQLLGSLPLDIKLPGKNDILAFSALLTLIERRKFSLSISLIQQCLYKIFKPNIVIVLLHIIPYHLSHFVKQSRPCYIKFFFLLSLTFFISISLGKINLFNEINFTHFDNKTYILSI